MIRRLLSRLIPGLASRLKVVPARDLGLAPERVSRGAFTVVRTLKEAGFKAFVVGGAVRDMLIGFEPKDFDVATDATPEQVKPLFRRAYVIGRRFRLVHVHIGAETVEVSTFRGQVAGEDARADEHGRILSDNVFGTQEEDAARRDFTINALYYDPVAEEVWDYLGGLRDIKARRLRAIGNAEQRYREDPVRMLRAVRLRARLDGFMDPKTERPIGRMAELAKNVPPARLFDEMLKLLLSGHAVASLHSLRAHGLHHGLLPMLDIILEQPMGQRFIELALETTDARVREGKPVSPAFLFATLLWHEVLAAWEAARQRGERPIPALHAAMDAVFETQAERIAIPRRYGTTVREIWELQPRFEQRSGQRPPRLLEHPRFRAAYDFLLLRCASGEVPAELGQWWTRYLEVDDDEREAMLEPEPPGEGRRRRRRRRRPVAGTGPAPGRGES